MVSYRIHARFVPTADSQLNLGFALFLGEMGLRASDITPAVGASAMLTNVALTGCDAALPIFNIVEQVGVEGLGLDWQVSGKGRHGSINPIPRRDQHNDFSSLTTEFATGPFSRLGLESGGIAQCAPPS